MNATRELYRRLHAEGPSREIDRALALLIGWQRKPGGEGEDDYWRRSDRFPWQPEDQDHPPRFTDSIDAAVNLYVEAPDRIPAEPIDVCLDALEQRL